MKHTKLALVTVLLFGPLSACKPEPAAPVIEAAPPVAEAAVTPAPAPIDTAPIDMEPTVTVPAAAPMPATDNPPAVTEDEEDTPHSGGDKVGRPPTN